MLLSLRLQSLFLKRRSCYLCNSFWAATSLKLIPASSDSPGGECLMFLLKNVIPVHHGDPESLWLGHLWGTQAPWTPPAVFLKDKACVNLTAHQQSRVTHCSAPSGAVPPKDAPEWDSWVCARWRGRLQSGVSRKHRHQLWLGRRSTSACVTPHIFRRRNANYEFFCLYRLTFGIRADCRRLNRQHFDQSG